MGGELDPNFSKLTDSLAPPPPPLPSGEKVIGALHYMDTIGNKKHINISLRHCCRSQLDDDERVILLISH